MGAWGAGRDIDDRRDRLPGSSRRASPVDFGHPGRPRGGLGAYNRACASPARPLLVESSPRSRDAPDPGRVQSMVSFAEVSMSRIHFVGGAKGGVGKSVLARLLAQFHIDRRRPFSAFDGDLSHGALVRYYSEFAVPVDIAHFESADRIAEAAAQHGHDVIVDLAAQAARPLDRWMSESGVLELGTDLDIGITLWHVMDDGTDSVRLLGEVLDAYGDGPDYVLVRNLGRGADFSLFDESAEKAKALGLGARVMDLPGLHAPTMRKIDRTGASLWAAANNKDPASGPALGLLERQRVRTWLNRAYAELERVLPPAADAA
jgi:hypothetical protein